MHLSSFNNECDKKGATIMIIIISRILINKDATIVDDNNLTLFLLFSAIILDTATGNPKLAILTNSEKVGTISIYIPTPSSVSNLVITILLSIPKSFVITPPIINIILDLMNFSFTLSPYTKYMKIYL